MSDSQFLQKDALALEEEGDRLIQEGQVSAALDCYKKSEHCDRNRVSIYEKLLLAHEKLSQVQDEWQESDMAEVLDWTMRLQELKTPRLTYLYHHLDGRGKQIEQLLQALMTSDNDAEEGRFLQEIEAYGVEAVRPLLYFFLSLKHTPPREAQS